jgi:hypothetical protein
VAHCLEEGRGVLVSIASSISIRICRVSGKVVTHFWFDRGNVHSSVLGMLRQQRS